MRAGLPRFGVSASFNNVGAHAHRAWNDAQLVDFSACGTFSSDPEVFFNKLLSDRIGKAAFFAGAVIVVDINHLARVNFSLSFLLHDLLEDLHHLLSVLISVALAPEHIR